MSSSDEVRLWREPVEGPPEFIPEAPGDPVTDRSYIALPAAKHAALMRVVEEAAIAVLRLEDARRNPLLAKAVSDYRALNATAPERQGEEPK